MRHLACTLALFLSASVCGGCANTSHHDPADVLSGWAARAPRSFVAESSVVVDAPFRDDFAFLGVVQVDREAGSFEFVGLSQTGVQYFHVSGDQSGNRVGDAIAPLLKQKRILLSFADDIRRMYLNTVPDGNAKQSAHSRYARFTTKSDDGKVVHDIGGTPPTLLQKRVKGFLRTKWRADYRNYATAGDASYPRDIQVKNGTYFYRLTVRTRSFELIDTSGETD